MYMYALLLIARSFSRCYQKTETTGLVRYDQFTSKNPLRVYFRTPTEWRLVFEKFKYYLAQKIEFGCGNIYTPINILPTIH